MSKSLKIAILTVVISFVLIFIYEQTTNKLSIQSDTITREAKHIGPGAHLLLPNLDKAIVVAPDRPHDPMELQNEETRKKITRLRQFTVTTSGPLVFVLRNCQRRKASASSALEIP